MYRKLLTIALIFLISVTAFGTQNSQAKDVEVNYDALFRPLIPHLKRKVDVLIRLPQSLKPFLSAGSKELYASIDESESDVYDVRIESEKECDGANYCYLGWISGQLRSNKNKDEIDATIRGGKLVQLANGLKGHYLDFSNEGNLHNVLSWEQEGVLYTVAMYGKKEQLMEIANSMILKTPINL